MATECKPGSRPTRASGAAYLFAVLAVLLTACGGTFNDAGAPPGGRSPGVPREFQPTLQAYEQRCEAIGKEPTPARVLWEGKREMMRGDSEPIAAAVTLNLATPAPQVLRRPGASSEDVFIISCRVEAQLSSSEYEFAIDHTGWIERSLLSTDTARWSWYVTPKQGGEHVVTLAIRPVLSVHKGIHSEVTTYAKGDIAEYEMHVHVAVPWYEWPADVMTKLADTLKVAEDTVKAATAFVVAVGALLAALGIRRHRKQSKGPAPDPAPSPR